jgi:Tfp pilus assembly protein PilF
LQEGINVTATRLWLLGSIVILLPAFLSAAAGTSVASGDGLELAKTWNASAEQFMNQGAYEEARRIYLRSLPVLETALGPEHPSTVTTLGNLCDASSHLSAWLDAKPLCARALALREKVFGPNHPDVARSLSDLGLVYAREGDLARAERLLERALRIERSLAEAPDMPSLLNNLGFLYSKKRKYARAEELFARAITTTEEKHGPEDPDLVTMLSNLGAVYLANHEFGAAEASFHRSLAIAECANGPNPVSGVPALLGLTRTEAALGRNAQAQMFLNRARGTVEVNRQAYLEWGHAIETARLDLTHK